MESINVAGPGCVCKSAGGGPNRRESRFDHGPRRHTNLFSDGTRRTTGQPAATPGPVLSVRGLRHRLDGETVLDDVAFDVREGEGFGLTGSAALLDTIGRTTIVRMVCGLMPADPGVVLAGGQPVGGTDDDPLDDPAAYVAHSVAVTASLTVGDTVRLWARLLGLPGTLGRERAMEVLALARIEEHTQTPVGRCPDGVLREMGLAVALLRRPRLLVLDEPTRGLNPRSRERLLETVNRVRGGGTAVLYAGRDVAEVREVCDRIGVLDRGRLVAQGRPEELPRLLTAA
ncbi:ATP-binding cassette domain-containing protein [Dactylosporangium sp. NPDC048998]|uniref:ATP-binding cassette domain-containing protein n=1 Tax=Dactylosporangium sp. NPDC048998 TaxID=3363976 RepID=UPI00371DB9E0